METVPLETDEITHGTDRKIRHEIHSMSMNGIYGIPPVLNCTPMRIKNTEVDRRVTCSGTGYWDQNWKKKMRGKRQTVSLPNHVQERGP